VSDDGAPLTESAGGTRDVGEVSVRELSELRDLLFGAERRQIDELRRRLDTAELTPDELAEKLPQAIVQRSARDRQLGIALAPTVENAIRESVRRNPREIATAIFPVLGPAIRKAIAETMSGLVNTINRAIEHSLSPQGIRWRIESWRTGVPFAQIVMRHALVYRVEQVLLVHAETGLLLAHVPDGSLGDADLVSSMLTAIGDFVNDSFEPKKTGELRAFAAGDLTVLVETGPRANIAAVVRGTPPDSLPAKLQTTLETIHLQWCDPLTAFNGDGTAFTTTRPLLEDCIETVLATDTRAKATGLRRFAWVIPVLLLLVGGIAWRTTQRNREWSAALARLDTEPGIAVIRSERSGGKWRIAGMRDPLAVNPSLLMASRGVDTNDVVARWEPYVSTEPALLLARARHVLAPPGGITLSLKGDTLVATGRAPAFWIIRADALAPALAGVGGVDLSHVTPGLPATMEPIAAEIESLRALFAAGSDALDQRALNTIATVAAKLRRLITAADASRYDLTMQIVGRADPTGAETDNLALSRLRAAAVRNRLLSLGINASRLTIDASGSGDPIPADAPAERARLNRSTSFTIRAQPSLNANTLERQR
jgi:outer membrane protein OmpA-like peptidoglycan-associated protein